eukprot:GHRR01014817.1.p1 GENE.GHRR01014817.1~~GHRR01014817.1.p1  ORF type:complete len:240 (+),score=75.00 GHRR01014817.1:984-1703(+)
MCFCMLHRLAAAEADWHALQVHMPVHSPCFAATGPSTSNKQAGMVLCAVTPAQEHRLDLALVAWLQGYGFNTFGEVCACWAQDIALIALIFRFSQTQKWAVAATGGLLALGCAWLMSPACPAHVLALLQASNIVTMALGSRLPQIVLNMRRGNAGVLSVTTCILNVAGNAARIFTTIVLTGDLLLLGGYLSQGTLNTILLCQSVGTARQKRHGAVILSDQHRRSSGPDASGGLQMQPAA